MARPDLSPQELCWLWRYHWSSIHQTPGDRCWWQYLWVLMVTSSLVVSGVGLTPPAVLSGALHPNPAPKGCGDPWVGLGGEALLDPKDGISGIAMPMGKALWGGRRGRRSYYTFYIQLLPYGQVTCAPNLRSVNDRVLYRTVTFDLHI